MVCISKLGFWKRNEGPQKNSNISKTTEPIWIFSGLGSFIWWQDKKISIRFSVSTVLLRAFILFPKTQFRDTCQSLQGIFSNNDGFYNEKTIKGQKKQFSTLYMSLNIFLMGGYCSWQYFIPRNKKKTESSYFLFRDMLTSFH